MVYFDYFNLIKTLTAIVCIIIHTMILSKGFCFYKRNPCQLKQIFLPHVIIVHVFAFIIKAHQ